MTWRVISDFIIKIIEEYNELMHFKSSIQQIKVFKNKRKGHEMVN
jgi:hypothetical protein